MQEREFEKQVKEQMQGFDLEPSSEVWTNVELRIRKEKKRRFIAWWFAAALLIAGGGMYYGWYDRGVEAKKEMAAIPSSSPDATPAAPASNNATAGKPVTNQQTPVIGETGDANTSLPAGILSAGEKSKTNDSHFTTGTASKTKNGMLQSSPAVVNTNKKRGLPASKKDEEAIVTHNREQPKVDISDASPGATAKSNLQPALTRASDLPNNTDSLKTAPDHPIATTKRNETDSAAVAKAKPAEEPQKVKRKNEWETGISLFAGKSNLGDGLGFSQDERMLDATTLGAVPPFPSTPQYVVREPQSSVSAGVGFFVKRKLSEKLNFYGDFKYTYLSTRVLTGNKVDSTPFANNSPVFVNVSGATSFFRPATSANSSNYTNRYHYLNLSAGISWNIIHRKRFKLYWDNSIGYGRLLGSNMLHYNSSLPGYYKDNDLLSKNQFFFSTGFTVPVSKRLELSAAVSYTPSSLLKNLNSDRLHFTQFGIGLRYFLKK